jgi:predicted GNAT family N-acyltransferase
MAEFTVTTADWDNDDDRAACEAVRTAVFVEEQKIPEHEEWDEHDDTSLHVIARDAAGTPIGTGRLLRDGIIGRVAVLKDWRGRKVGDAIMHLLIAEARKLGVRESVLHAQTYAIPFYERFGYQVEGHEFIEASIPHRRMRLVLEPVRGEAGGGQPDLLVRRVRSLDQCRQAALEIAKLARYRLAIMTPDLEPALYGSPEFRDELRRIARASRFSLVRILVRDAQRATREGHLLVELALALPTYVQIRVPNPDDEQRTDAFVIADDDAILYRVAPESPDGVVEIEASALARERLRSFERLWERAQPDPNFRRLGI